MNRQVVPSTTPLAKWPAIVSAIIALSVYAVTLGGTFIFDDVLFLDDPRIAHPGEWGRFFTESYNGGVDNLYRPWVLLSFGFQRWMTGLHPVPLHAVNWFLHASVAALVAVLACRLTGRQIVAWVAGPLFAVLPIHTEVVAGIVGRADLLCTVGIVGGLVLALHPMTRMRALAITGCLLLALGSKEQGLLLPLIGVVMAVCRGVRRPRDEDERQSMMLLLLMGCWCTAGFLVYHESILKFDWYRSLLDWTEQPLLRATGASRVLMPVELLGRYLALIVWPARLSIDYGGNVIGWVTHSKDPYLWIGFTVLLIWGCGIGVALKMRNRAALFCLLAIALLYAMVGNFPILIGTNFGERLMYTPSVFLCILIGIALSRLPSRTVGAIVGLLVIAGGARSAVYARQWNDRLRFYETQSAMNPASVRLHMLLSFDAAELGRMDEASEAARLGRLSTPDYDQVWIQSGRVAMQAGNLKDARTFLTRANQINPSVAVLGYLRQLQKLEAATQATTLPSSK